MRRSRQFYQKGSKFDNIHLIICLYLVDEGIEDPNIIINGPSFEWRFAGGRMMAQH